MGAHHIFHSQSHLVLTAGGAFALILSVSVGLLNTLFPVAGLLPITILDAPEKHPHTLSFQALLLRTHLPVP